MSSTYNAAALLALLVTSACAPTNKVEDCPLLEGGVLQPGTWGGPEALLHISEDLGGWVNILDGCVEQWHLIEPPVEVDGGFAVETIGTSRWAYDLVDPEAGGSLHEYEQELTIGFECEQLTLEAEWYDDLGPLDVVIDEPGPSWWLDCVYGA